MTRFWVFDSQLVCHFWVGTWTNPCPVRGLPLTSTLVQTGVLSLWIYCWVAQWIYAASNCISWNEAITLWMNMILGIGSMGQLSPSSFWGQWMSIGLPVQVGTMWRDSVVGWSPVCGCAFTESFFKSHSSEKLLWRPVNKCDYLEVTYSSIVPVLATKYCIEFPFKLENNSEAKMRFVKKCT